MGGALRKGCSDVTTHKTWFLLQYTDALDMLQPLCLATSVDEASLHLLQYGLSNYFATAQMPLTFHATMQDHISYACSDSGAGLPGNALCWKLDRWLAAWG